MTEVEDVPGPAACPSEHVERLCFDPLPRRQQHGGVEIALDGTIRHLGPADIERDAPVETDHVTARDRHLPEQRRRTGAEVNRGNVDGIEDAS